MTKMSDRGCPICGNMQCDVLHSQKFVLPEGHPLRTGYDIVCCHSCGFVYADITISQRDYDGFYAYYSKYEDNATSSGGGESPWDAERLIQSAAFIAKYLPNKRSKILDVGCANGGLLKSFQELGYMNLVGIDPSPVCAENTRSLYGIETHAISLFSIPEELGRFDCVILSHVMEHVVDLSSAVKQIFNLTLQDGISFIEVPDASRYVDVVIAPFQDFNTEHINHFSLQCLANLFLPAGWKIEKQGGKIIYSAPNILYPSIYAIYSRAADRGNIIHRDTQLRESILDYIKRSQVIMKNIEDNLFQILKKSPEVIVWGTGQLAMKLLAETSLGRARIAAFVDGNPINHGRLLHGQPILAPEQIRRLDYPIIITSILHWQEIADLIRTKMGLSNPVIPLFANR